MISFGKTLDFLIVIYPELTASPFQVRQILLKKQYCIFLDLFKCWGLESKEEYWGMGIRPWVLGKKTNQNTPLLMSLGLLNIDTTVDKKLVQNHHIPKYSPPYRQYSLHFNFLSNYFRVSSSKFRFKNNHKFISQDTAFRQELERYHLLTPESSSVRLD